MKWLENAHSARAGKPTADKIDEFLRKNAQRLAGIGVACSVVTMRNLAIVVVVAALFASTAAVSVKHQRGWTGKLDSSLMQAVDQDSQDSVRTVIQVRPGATERVVSHLEHHGLKPARLSTADLVAVQLPASMLRNVAGDSDVVRLSSAHEDRLTQ